LTAYTLCVMISAMGKLNITHWRERMFINIEVERLRRYMSKAELAKALQVSADTLSDWVHQRRAIPAEGLRALSRLFEGCSIDYLLKEMSN